MQQEKKLTLQQYIECYNIKKQLQQRSKEKSRSKSRDRAASQRHIPINPHDNSSMSVNRSKQKNKFNSHQQLSNTIYDQVDFRARNLYNQLQQTINSIKLQCRGLIRNDKDFAFFIKLMDSLINKFRSAVMHIHRQNLLLFQMSKQTDKTFLTEKDELTKTHIENLEKSFNQQYQLSKSQYESKLNFVPNKTIKQRMQENKQGEQLVKTIFGGLSKQSTNQKKVTLKTYDTEPKDQQQRIQRKKQAVSFLGFIMRNIPSGKKNQEIKQSPESYLSNVGQEDKQVAKNQSKTIPSSMPQIPIPNENKPRKQDDKMVKNINYLNSCGKGNLNAVDIDDSNDSHNLSFGVDIPQTHKSIPNIIKVVPKSPVKSIQKRPSKGKSPPGIQRREVAKEMKISQQKISQKRKSQQFMPSSPQPTTRIQLIQRTNTKTKGKPPIRLSTNKRPN